MSVDASQRFLSQLRGVIDPERKRRIIGHVFIDVFEEEAQRIGRRRLPGAGHALPRRDRERLGEGPLGHHQDPPQRRGASRAHAPEAGGAAARALQGRGARGGAPSWACRGRGSAPALPGAGPRRPHPGRGHARAARRAAARPTPSSSRRSRGADCYDEIWQAFAVLLPVQHASA